jgi:DNA-binding ferritin-like protein
MNAHIIHLDNDGSARIARALTALLANALAHYFKVKNFHWRDRISATIT